MKRIIDIPDEMYDDIEHGYICSEYADKLIQLIPISKPYEEQPQGECKGGFQLTELRRWLTSQGYSEGAVDDKIENFWRFLERIRGEEE